MHQSGADIQEKKGDEPVIHNVWNCWVKKQLPNHHLLPGSLCIHTLTHGKPTARGAAFSSKVCSVQDSVVAFFTD